MQKRGRASTVSPISLFLSRAISFLSAVSLFVCTPCTLSDASCSADQRDFCLKHDLSLKYLKPDYLWVCHLGRRNVTPAGQWRESLLLSSSLFFFAKSDALMQVKSHAFEFSLRTWNALSSSLSYPLPSSFIDEEHPTTPSRMQWNLTRSLYNGRYSFIIWTHFPAARSRVWDSFSLSLSLSFILHVLTKVLSTVIATTIWIHEPHKARSKRANKDNISLDMQISVVQLRAFLRCIEFYLNVALKYQKHKCNI